MGKNRLMASTATRELNNVVNHMKRAAALRCV